MKVLVVGSGGREHAIAWKLASSPSVTKVIASPGNPGTAACAENRSVAADNVGGLVALAKAEGIDLVVVGPEAPLVKGLADALAKEGIPTFGPEKAGAELEGSKAFSKALMARHGIPTAGFKTFTEVTAARRYLEGNAQWPVVLKASGLAAGKGVLICQDKEEALAGLDQIMVDRSFGASGETVVIEEFLSGEEVSVHCLTDGRTILTLPTSQDHKRARDGDEGPNTGGMGAVSPGGPLDARGLERVEREVLFPTVHALRHDQRRFRGVLYAGLMITRTGPKVLEYNVRFGDPEAQVILPRLQCDFGTLLLACAEGRLEELPDDAFSFDPRVAITVVLASGGYPGAFRRGVPIDGVAKAAALPDVHVFHAGTSGDEGRLTTAGGRVLTVTALGDDVEAARARAYEAAKLISFEGCQYRSDIGHRALRS